MATDEELNQLRAENEELRRQLAEATDTLRAIRSGEVDALVIEGPEANQLYTLESAFEPYRVFVEHMQEGAASLTADGLILSANPRFAEITRVPHERLVGSSLYDVLGETNRTAVERLLCDESSAPRAADLVLAPDPGGSVHVFVTATEAPDGTRCLVVTDVTDRIRLGEAIASRDWLRVTLSSIGDAVISCDPGGRITFLNAVAADLTGWSGPEALGQPIQTVFHIVDEVTGQPAEDVIGRVLDEGRVVLLGNHIALIARDGRQLSIEDSAAPIRDGAGRITGAVLVFHDVTQKRHFHHEIKKSEARFRALFEHSPDAVVLTRRDGAIVNANPAACAMFGATEEWLKTVGRAGILDVADRRVSAALEDLERTGVLRDVELSCVRQNGERFPGETSSATLPGDDSLAFIIIRDVTDRRRAEERLREQAARLREANRTKDDFLATLSHELRTPMHAVVGWAQMLTARQLDAGTRERGLQAILRNSQAQLQLITDMLDVSRIVSGRMRLNVQQVDLVQVVYAALDSVRPAADAKRIDLATSVMAGSTVVEGDPDRLQQAVWNLLSNAVKFTPAGGRIDVSLQRTGSAFAIRVRDNGIGIDPVFLPRVFERFTQADTSAGRRHGGLGLGLSIVRHLVEMHGGTVEGESEGEGKGATFEIRLPSRFAREAAAEKSAAQSGAEAPEVVDAVSLAGVRVLIVDDETDARDLLSTGLADHRADIVAVASAIDGLDHLQKGRFDLLLADIGMPGIDGYELIARVRRLDAPANRTIPAIALTAYGGRDDAARALACGYNLHLTKPVAPSLLAAAITRLLRRPEPSS